MYNNFQRNCLEILRNFDGKKDTPYHYFFFKIKVLGPIISYKKSFFYQIAV